MITLFFLGALIGILTGIPIGPANVAVIDTAYKRKLSRAIAVGWGAGFADGIYAMIGVLGIGPILQKNPAIEPILYAISGVVLLVYGILTSRPQPDKGPQTKGVEIAAKVRGENNGLISGFAFGMLVIMLNPAAVITWVVVVGTYLSEVTRWGGMAAAAGVCIGSCLWFTLVAYLAHHGRKALGDKAFWITRIVGFLLVIYGCYSLYRAVCLWLTL